MADNGSDDSQYDDPANAPTLVGSGSEGAARSVRSSRTPARIATACYLCQNSSKPLPYNTAGQQFCSECNAGVRAKHRVLRQEGRETAVKADKDLLLTEPRKWRAETLVWLGKEGRGKARAAVRTTTRKVKSHATGKRHQRRRTKVILNKTRYKRYVAFWDGMDSADASSDFERLRTEQGGGDEVKILDLGAREDSVSFSEEEERSEEEEAEVDGHGDLGQRGHTFQSRSVGAGDSGRRSRSRDRRRRQRAGDADGCAPRPSAGGSREGAVQRRQRGPQCTRKDRKRKRLRQLSRMIALPSW